jgi:hypothetical protein
LEQDELRKKIWYKMEPVEEEGNQSRKKEKMALPLLI